MRFFLSATFVLVGLLGTLSVSATEPASPSQTGKIDWPSFLGKNDLIWDKLPDSWNTAPFIGNGNLGTIFWQESNGPFHFEISREDLYDHRALYRMPDGRAADKLFSVYRLPNGHFSLDLGSPKPTGTMRLDLWNAETRGEIAAGGTTWRMRCFAPADANLIVLELINPEAKQAPQWKWLPDPAKSPRERGAPANILPYPPQVQKTIGDAQVSVQEMPEDAKYNTVGLGPAQYATAWRFFDLGQGHFICLISLEFSPHGTDAAQRAVDDLKQGIVRGLAGLETSHRAWWHSFYSQSFVSLPDGALESFYWAQIYKMGSASRQGGPLLDLMGPWYMPSGWPAIWWNLNIQLTYWPFYMSNHLAEAEPLHETLWNQRAVLAANAAPHQDDSYAVGRVTGPDCAARVGGDVGNLPWTMHNLWLYYRSSMDDALLREKIFPLMKGSFRYLRHLAVTQPDGTLTMPKTASPEYTDGVENCSYTLACFRWLARTLIEADARLHTNDPIVAECHEVLDHLTPYEVDPATGVMIGKGMPLACSHRHWSHLFMIYPFHEWDWNNAKQRPLMEQSLAHWTSMPEMFRGYSWLAAATMQASAGHGDLAVENLHTFLKKSVLPNTLYREGYPVIETPLAAARVIQELLLTGDGDCLRIFPGIPTDWAEASFADLRAEGAFLVSAQRSNGRTQFVTITSLAGEPCRVATGISGPVNATGTRVFKVQDKGNGVVEVDLQKGETVTLFSKPSSPSLQITPVERKGTFHPWGGRKSLP